MKSKIALVSFAGLMMVAAFLVTSCEKKPNSNPAEPQSETPEAAVAQPESKPAAPKPEATEPKSNPAP